MLELTHPTAEDIKKVFAFMEAYDVAEFDEPDSSFEDLEEQWSEIDLSQDAWVAFEGDRIVGYACLEGGPARFNLDLYAHPSLSPNGLAEQLVDAAILRAQELLKKESNAGESRIVAYASSNNSILIDMYKKSDFLSMTYHYRMQTDFTEPILPPMWPQGFHLSPFKPEDELELYHLIESAFTWHGRQSSSIDDWRGHVFRGGRFDPELFIMVRKSEKLVAAVLSYDEEVRGWVKQLAVSPELQGMGIGSLLLKQIMSVFSARKVPTVALGVASENKNACQFYERCGMRRSREFTELHKKIY